jgi:hypothetical protein
MENTSNIKTFSDFWPTYLEEHASRTSRWCHLGGLIVAAVLAAALVSIGMFFFLPLAVVPAHLGARLGHRLSPRTATVVAESPVWGAAADLKMCALMLTGRLDRHPAI